MERTTDLAVIRHTPGAFTWGDVVDIHDIGLYSLIEYTDHHDRKTGFHVYVDGHSTNNTFPTMDEAILFAIARKNLEPNEARFMAIGATKLLNVK